jgi:hypothetical protein
MLRLGLGLGLIVRLVVELVVELVVGLVVRLGLEYRAVSSPGVEIPRKSGGSYYRMFRLHHKYHVFFIWVKRKKNRGTSMHRVWWGKKAHTLAIVTTSS